MAGATRWLRKPHAKLRGGYAVVAQAPRKATRWLRGSCATAAAAPRRWLRGGYAKLRGGYAAATPRRRLRGGYATAAATRWLRGGGASPTQSYAVATRRLRHGGGCATAVATRRLRGGYAKLRGGYAAATRWLRGGASPTQSYAVAANACAKLCDGCERPTQSYAVATPFFFKRGKLESANWVELTGPRRAGLAPLLSHGSRGNHSAREGDLCGMRARPLALWPLGCFRTTVASLCTNSSTEPKLS